MNMVSGPTNLLDFLRKSRKFYRQSARVHCLGRTTRNCLPTTQAEYDEFVRGDVGGCSNTAPHSLWSSGAEILYGSGLSYSKNATSIVFTCDFDIRAFFGFALPSPTHCII